MYILFGDPPDTVLLSSQDKNWSVPIFIHKSFQNSVGLYALIWLDIETELI